MYYFDQEICCKELNFLKQIKDLQAPIEVTTYDEVKAILESGEYNIRCKYHQICYSAEEIISLKCKSCSGKDMTYTTIDLKDLESKIVLIRDHRSNDQVSNVQNVDNKNPQMDSSSFGSLSPNQIEEFLNVRKKLLMTDPWLHIIHTHNTHGVHMYTHLHIYTQNKCTNILIIFP